MEIITDDVDELMRTLDETLDQFPSRTTNGAATVMPATVTEALADPSAISGYLSMIPPSVTDRVAEFKTVPWVRRFVVLTRGFLLVFASSAKAEFVLDYLRLSSHSIMTPVIVLREHAPLAFGVGVDADTLWLLSAATKTAKDSWCASIAAEIAIAPNVESDRSKQPSAHKIGDANAAYSYSKDISPSRPSSRSPNPISFPQLDPPILETRSHSFNGKDGASPLDERYLAKQARKSDMQLEILALQEELEFHQQILYLQQQKIASQMPAYDGREPYTAAPYTAPQKQHQRKYSSMSSDATTLRGSWGAAAVPLHSISEDYQPPAVFSARTSSLGPPGHAYHLSRGSPLRIATSPPHSPANQHASGYPTRGETPPVDVQEMTRSHSVPAKKASIFNLMARMKKN
ncbi:hypothetical protein BJ741DRAFT_172697 [Chytriomyces cf. hyalinus JEL632]|nr:hypothetical protein BJ741DRAFT_172697 [Chytriomyces cf. hyalinus JEL632]